MTDHTETREQLERAIDEIERIRSTEVRSASRRLSPAFGSVGLDTALQDLANSWNKVKAVRVHFDARHQAFFMSCDVSRELETAPYRVSEQALLNGAPHGKTSRVEGSLPIPTPDSLVLNMSEMDLVWHVQASNNDQAQRSWMLGAPQSTGSGD